MREIFDKFEVRPCRWKPLEINALQSDFKPLL
jgi:hypothetical protein